MRNFKHAAKMAGTLNSYINSENHMVFYDGQQVRGDFTVDEENKDIWWWNKHSGFKEFASEFTNPMQIFREHEVHEVKRVNWRKKNAKHGEGV